MLETSEPLHNVAAIILAAGSSRRLGQPKQLVLLGEQTLLERAVSTCCQAGCDSVLVVLGAASTAILAQSTLAPARILFNAEWEEGMASSIRAGINALTNASAATLVLTCDQPAVTAAHLRRLASESPAEPVASAYAGKQGVPAYFPAGSFPDLLQLTGDHGAGRILTAARAIPLPGGEVDVDTPESLLQARALFRKNQ